MHSDHSFTILLVDDDPDDIELVREIVRKLHPGITCLAAENGLVAIEMLRVGLNSLPNLVILDLMMPVLNGEQFLEKMKVDPLLKQIPVIVWSTSNYLSQTLIEKYNVFLFQKPGRFSEMEDLLKSILDDTDLSARLVA
ncbi:MAG: response regulator [Bacteroidota bacterium]